jgi:hypothetical protein
LGNYIVLRIQNDSRIAKTDLGGINFICGFHQVLNMPKERKQKNAANAKEISLEEILKQLPPPPPEHAHELNMEKRVKQLLKEQKKKQ